VSATAKLAANSTMVSARMIFLMVFFLSLS
jgi:hypothetical protein